MSKHSKKSGCDSNKSKGGDSLKLLPKSLQSFANGWKEDAIEEEGFTVMTLEEYSNIDFSTKMRTNYLSMADFTIQALTRKGLQVSSVNIFEHNISDQVLLSIVEFTTEQLVKCGHVPTSLLEYQQFQREQAVIVQKEVPNKLNECQPIRRVTRRTVKIPELEKKTPTQSKRLREGHQIQTSTTEMQNKEMSTKKGN